MRIWSDYARGSGLLIVLSGPSGVGKDAVLSEFRSICPEVRKCVTCTTRAMRDSEVDGVDYKFLTVDEFTRLRGEGGFLEHTVYNGNMYGTPKAGVEELLALGHDVILKIEVEGGSEVRRQMPDCVMVFLVPPSLEILESRLRNRQTDSEAEIEGRLAKARYELEQIPKYDYIIENDSLREAAEDLKAVIIAEHCRIRKR